MRSRFLALLALLLALGLIWVGFSMRDRGGAAPIERGATLATVPVREEPVASIQASDAPVAERSALPAADASVRDSFQVLVVERGSGAPIAGADVRGANANEITLRDPKRPQSQADVEEAIGPIGARATTDSNGVAWIAQRGMRGIVTARFQDRWGSAWFSERDEPPIRIELDVDREIVILVIDGAGEPVAGVPVAIRNCPGDGARNDLWTTLTGADGLAHARHVDSLLKRWPGRRVCVSLSILARGLESVPLDPNALPAEPIRLTLPPTGSVEVVTVSEGSRPVFVKNLQIGDASTLDAHGMPSFSGGQYSADRIEEGRAEFGHVGLGFELYATPTALAYEFEPSTSRARGPQDAGEHVKMIYDLGRAHPAIVLRIVDEKHVALRDLDLAVMLNVSSSRGSMSHVGNQLQSVTDGHVRLPLPSSSTTGLAGGLFLSVVSPGAHEDWRARFEIPAELHEGDNDLGDLVLEPPGLVCGGIVVDDAGASVPHASVFVENRSTPGDKWSPTFGLNATSNAHGEFAIQGSAPAGAMRVRANDREHAYADPVEAKPGTRDLRLVVPRGAELAGSVLLDESFPRDQVGIVVVRTDEAARSRREYDRREIGRPEPDGAFTLTGLRAGDVDVQIKSTLQREPLIVVERVPLAPGVVTRDPRLQRVDLRDARSIHLAVVDERDAPIIQGGGWCVSPARDPQAFYFKDGKATILARAPSFDLVVRAPGYRSAHVRGTTGDTRVVLQRGFPVRVRLPEGFQLPEAPRQLGLRLRLVGESGAAQNRMPAGVPDDSVDTFIEVGTESLVVVPAAGTYEMRWLVRADPEMRTKPRELANARVERVEISESDVERSVTGQPDSAELADALRALDRK